MSATSDLSDNETVVRLLLFIASMVYDRLRRIIWIWTEVFLRFEDKNCDDRIQFLELLFYRNVVI